TDKTVQVAKQAKANKVVSHPKNAGLGITFKDGIWEALKMGADLIVNIDADGQFNPKDIPKLIAPILNGTADVTTCSRFKDKALEEKTPGIKRFGNMFFTKLVNFLTKENFTDTQCGFRAYSKEAALRMNLFGKFTYTQESLLDLINKGMRIDEVACRVEGQRDGESRIVKHWWTYGIKALLIITRNVRDYRPLQFFGGLGILVTGAGVLYGAIQWTRSLAPGADIPFWRIILTFLLILVGALMIVLALIADMNSRQRTLQEETLYKLKKQEIATIAKGGK
ncbi:MAG: glycosyltransferase family 2 protein, partial [archaeon]|nr:glycosyltransferase family 2 protein [archaeon]